MVMVAHKIELKSNNIQETYFKKACGISRFTWNWALNEWNEQYKIGLKPNGMKLKKQFNALKESQYPWIYEVTKYASQQPFINLQKAYVKFFKKTSDHPVFKKKNHHDSFYIGGDQIQIEGRRIKIPILGWVKMRERLRFKGKINSVVVSRTANRWYVSIQMDSPLQFQPLKNQESVGIDLGIHHFATLSDGKVFKAPKPLKEKLRLLKRQQRILSRKIKGFKNYFKQSMQVAIIHMKIANVRKDFLHKLTTFISNNYSLIGIEDLPFLAREGSALQGGDESSI